MIKYVRLSIFESPAQAIVNTVNTVGVMGKGIALSYKKLYPDMYRQYRALCLDDKLKIGILHFYRTPNKTVINFPTKQHWRQRSRIEYIHQGLARFVEVYAAYGIASVSFPQLGCGNGELDWDSQVQPVMEEYLSTLPIPVYVHLYDQSPTFVPERLDKAYAREVMQARYHPSSETVWQDIIALVQKPQQLDLFELTAGRANATENKIEFPDATLDSLVVYREDFDDVWNALRLRGSIGPNEFPSQLSSSVVEKLVAYMSKLDYVRTYSDPNSEATIATMYYAPLPSDQVVDDIVTV